MNSGKTPPVGHRFKKGDSGNPKGRPKIVKHVQELCRELTEDAIDALKRALADEGSVSVQAANSLLAYGYGRPVQTQNLRVIRRIEDLTDAELMAIAGIEQEGQSDAVH